MNNIIPFNEDIQGDLFGVEDRPDEDNISTKKLGRYAEFLICAELSKLGYDVWHCDAPGFDVIFVTEERSLRIQVRSTTHIENGHCMWMLRKGYGNRDKTNYIKTRPIDRRDADLIALHHLVLGTTVLIGIDDISAGGAIRLPISQVRNHDLSESLERVLARL